jgi:hypothetical protein
LRRVVERAAVVTGSCGELRTQFECHRKPSGMDASD